MTIDDEVFFSAPWETVLILYTALFNWVCGVSLSGRSYAFRPGINPDRSLTLVDAKAGWKLAHSKPLSKPKVECQG